MFKRKDEPFKHDAQAVLLSVHCKDAPRVTSLVLEPKKIDGGYRSLKDLKQLGEFGLPDFLPDLSGEFFNKNIITSVKEMCVLRRYTYTTTNTGRPLFFTWVSELKEVQDENQS